MEFHFHSGKKLDGFSLKFWDLSGAKVWKSCRSRKTWKNEYLVAIVAVDTAENEPLKVWGDFIPFSIRLLINLTPQQSFRTRALVAWLDPRQASPFWTPNFGASAAALPHIYFALVGTDVAWAFWILVDAALPHIDATYVHRVAHMTATTARATPDRRNRHMSKRLLVFIPK